MTSNRVNVKIGRVDWGNIPAKVSAAVVKELAEATIRRTRKRVDHPATRALQARGINQYRADISGPRGGPGVIKPVRAKALRFNPGGGFIFRKSVNGKGLEPLITAEGKRLTQGDIKDINERF